MSLNIAESPGEILETALRLLGEPDTHTAGLWPRAAAMLGRQALEAALAELWRSMAPGLEDSSFRTQLLCLPSFLSGTSGLPGSVSHTWGALSRACHYHPYELAPTRAELVVWLGTVRDLIAEIDTIRRRRAIMISTRSSMDNAGDLLPLDEAEDPGRRAGPSRQT
jgi:hypothetical protein